jgi:hypothetical protein
MIAAPSVAKADAKAAPMPDVDPVISAVFPANIIRQIPNNVQASSAVKRG